MNNTISILVVDDSLMELQITVGYLRQYFEVHATTSGQIALEMISTHKPKIVLLDVNMPEVDGYEVCRRIREKDKHLKVIFISAYDSTTEILKGYTVGGNDYIVKPYEPVILLSKINQAIHDETEYEEASHSSAGLAMEAMTSFGELGHVLTFLRSSFLISTIEGLADLMLSALAGYGLEVCLQLRTPGGAANFSSQGTPSPIEEELLSRIAKMNGRLAESGTRMFINYDHASLMVKNMPFGDDVKMGRLRDNLAILLEAADERLAMIAINVSVNDSLELVRSTHQELVTNYVSMVDQNLEQFKAALLNVGLDQHQENDLIGVIQGGKQDVQLYFEKMCDIENQIMKIRDIVDKGLKDERYTSNKSGGIDFF